MKYEYDTEDYRFKINPICFFVEIDDDRYVYPKLSDAFFVDIRHEIEINLNQMVSVYEIDKRTEVGLKFLKDKLDNPNITWNNIENCCIDICIMLQKLEENKILMIELNAEVLKLQNRLNQYTIYIDD